MDNSSSNMKAAKKRGEWAEAAKVSSSSHPVTDPAPRTHFKVCNKCNQKKSLADFEGYKRCKDCREHNTKNWHRLMKSYSKAGVGQRIPLSDLEKDKIETAFGHSCAFCGSGDEKKLRFTRLIRPRSGGGDELFNIILSCSSCIVSRRGWADWEEWYKDNTSVYSPLRYNRVIAWHNELPMPKGVIRDR